MNKLIIILGLILASCCPTISGLPGDSGAMSWSPTGGLYDQTIIDCNGGHRKSMVITESGTTVRNCVVDGDIRIMGIARNGNSSALKDLSRQKDYVKTIRDRSPSYIKIENTKIYGSGTIPLYIAPGVTFVHVSNVFISGYSKSVMVYLDAETSRITIEDSTIYAKRAEREAIAIDASDHNIIQRNIIVLSDDGGIFTYRNCGEGGNIRHTTPSYNNILGNTFTGDGVAIYLGSRGGHRCYCDEDEGYPFGSSQSDMDHSRYNVVDGNKLNGSKIKIGSSFGNTIQKGG